MNVSLSEVFEFEKAQLDMFQANDLDRFVERTRNGHLTGFLQFVQVVGMLPDESLVGVTRNGEASCEFVWFGENVLFTRAFAAPQEFHRMPQWVQQLG